MTKHTVILYFDIQDPNNPGWAFRHYWHGYDENGDATEDKEESGYLDVVGSESARRAWYEDERPIDDPHITWTALPEGWRGTWTEE